MRRFFIHPSQLYHRYQQLSTRKAYTYTTLTLLTSYTSVCLYNKYARQRAFTQRYGDLRPAFNDGSTDQMMMHSLHTGDLLLFKYNVRDFVWVSPLKALTVLLMKYIHSTDYIHAALIWCDEDSDYQPYVLEQRMTDNNITVQPYDERIIYSRASDIEIRRLQLDEPLYRQQFESQYACMQPSQLQQMQAYAKQQRTVTIQTINQQSLLQHTVQCSQQLSHLLAMSVSQWLGGIGVYSLTNAILSMTAVNQTTSKDRDQSKGSSQRDHCSTLR